MRTLRTALAALSITFAAAAAASADSEGSRQSGYSYIRVATGGVTVESQSNGTVEARRNLPISSGDEIRTTDGGRAEIALADGNLLHVGGGTTARFESLAAQQGDSADFSSIHLVEGSLILSTLGAAENEIPRIDTEDVTVYLNPDSRVRVNAEPNRGTVVIARAGSAEVRTPQGSNTLRAGQYLMVQGNEEPEISRGAFSHDRFDTWTADRIETLSDSHSASARYVDEDHASDVVALDGYGDWSYNGTYSTSVWSPRVDSGWTPYSYGSWYYTPAGLTWWSYDPWGWYPFHYGNWFFDVGWGRWCWAPAYVYSPAWVYWGYTRSYVGWCPIGYYSFYSPWWRTYYRNWGWAHHRGVAFAINGTFSARSVDFRGWNFVGAKNFGSGAKSMDVIPGSRIAGRLGDQVAISSRPIVVGARDGATREAIREFVRQAPSAIARTGSADSSRMGPVLARKETLPPETIEALRQRGAVAERGRLSGPGATGLAPRGAVVEQSRSIAAPPSRESLSAGRGSGKDQTNSRGDWRQTERRVTSQPSAPEDWRGRSGNALSERPVPSTRPPSAETERPSEGWRSRSEMPPARRVIEGAVPGRRSLEATDPGTSRSRESRPSGQWDAPRSAPPQREEARPAPPAPRSEPRMERARPAPPRPPASSHHDRKPN